MSERQARFENVAEARLRAKRRLPKSLYEMVEGGSETASTLQANVRAFEEVLFRPRAAAGWVEPDLRTTVLGSEISMPVLTAPAGMVRLVHPDGEVGVARAAGAAGTISIVSTMSGYTIEEIATASTAPTWYQLYPIGGEDIETAAIARARSAGCTALVVTVDAAAAAGRERLHRVAPVPLGIDWRNAFRFMPQLALRPRWLLGFLRDGLHLELPNLALARGAAPMSIQEAVAASVSSMVSWSDVRRIGKRWAGPLVVKGILSGDDARRAVDAGAAAVVVSNHGGNALDGVPPTLRRLPEVLAAVDDVTEVLLDGGVRRGSDVVKAIAMGARAVLVGRAWIWGLAAGGEAGVRRILEVLRNGIRQTLTLLGCASIRDLDPSWVETSWSAPRLVRERQMSC